MAWSDDAQRTLRGLQSQAAHVPVWGWAVAGVAGLLLLGAVANPGPPNAPLPPGGSPKGPMPTIKAGSEGSAVSVWQQVVGAPVTGKFDAATVAATKTWQAAHGLTADAIVGPKSWSAAGYPTGGTTANPTPGGGGGPDIGATPVPGGGGFELSNNYAQREQQILGAILDGAYEIEWVPVQLADSKGNTATVYVTRRALRLAAGDARLTVSGSYWAQQQAADMLNAAMLTTKVSDAIWNQADRKLPVLSRTITNKTADMIDQSAKIDAALDAAGGDGDHLLVANEGKDWLNSRLFWPVPAGTNGNKPTDKPNAPEGVSGSPHNSVNFGWYLGTHGQPGPGFSPSGEGVVQTQGLAHNKGDAPGVGHGDYSQLWRFMRRDVTVNGQTRDVAEVLADPAVSSVLQDEGGTMLAAQHPDYENVVA